LHFAANRLIFTVLIQLVGTKGFEPSTPCTPFRLINILHESRRYSFKLFNQSLSIYYIYF